MDNDRGLTVAGLRERLDYEPETGLFYWALQRKSRDVVGTLAGGISTDGYRVIHIDGIDRLGHRLAWAHWFGTFPCVEIDHINSVRNDNRIENLRLADRSQQAQNRGVRSDNKCGIKGCRWDEKEQRYLVRVGFKGKRVIVGRFRYLAEAATAYDAVAKTLFGDFAKLNGVSDADKMLDDRRVRVAIRRLRDRIDINID